MKKGTFQHIESELYGYHDTLKDIENRRQAIMYDSAPEENSGGGRGSMVSSPTERIATLLVSDRQLQELDRIASAIEHVYNICDKDRKRLIQLKYWTRPQTKNWTGIAMDLNVSRRTAFRWRDEIVQAVGEQLGWR